MNPRPWKINAYLVTFDEHGATIVHQVTGDRYRVHAATATNRLHFSRYHIDLCCAMVGNHPEDLEPYRVPVIDGGGIACVGSLFHPTHRGAQDLWGMEKGTAR